MPRHLVLSSALATLLFAVTPAFAAEPAPVLLHNGERFLRMHHMRRNVTTSQT